MVHLAWQHRAAPEVAVADFCALLPDRYTFPGHQEIGLREIWHLGASHSQTKSDIHARTARSTLSVSSSIGLPIKKGRATYATAGMMKKMAE